MRWLAVILLTLACGCGLPSEPEGSTSTSASGDAAAGAAGGAGGDGAGSTAGGAAGTTASGAVGGSSGVGTDTGGAASTGGGIGSTAGSSTGGGTAGAICAPCTDGSECLSGFCNTFLGAGFCDTAAACTPSDCAPFGCDSATGACICGGGTTTSGPTSGGPTAGSTSSGPTSGGPTSGGGTTGGGTTGGGTTGSCVPSCSGRVCGDDGCGGSCGGCNQGVGCDSEGFCTQYAFQPGDPTPTGITSIDQWSCSPAPGRAALGPVSVTIDGDVSDWPASARILVDDPGDQRAPGAGFDLREVYAGFGPGGELRLGLRLGAPADPSVLYQVFLQDKPRGPLDHGVYQLDSFQVVGGNQVNWVHHGADGDRFEPVPQVTLGFGTDIELEVPASLAPVVAAAVLRIDARTFDPARNYKEIDVTGLYVQGGASQGCRIQLGRGPVDIYVHEPAAGSAEFAQTALYSFTTFLPLIESLVGEAWPFPTLDVFATDDIDLTTAGAKGFNGINYIGMFQWGPMAHTDLRMGFGMVAHEGAHTWNGSMKDAWLREGHSNWIYLRAVRALSGFRSEHQAVLATVDALRNDPGTDDPLDTWATVDLTQPHTDFLYSKAMVAHWVLASLYGEDRLGRVARQQHQLGGTDSATFEAALAAVAGPVDDGFLGWVRAGSYVWPLAAGGSTFEDPDRDALLGAEEAGQGSNPGLADTDGDGLADGFEAYHGLSPTRADSDFDGTDDLAALGGRAIDGLAADWQAYPGGTSAQNLSALDPGCGPEMQLTGMTVERSGNTLRVLFTTAAPPLRDFSVGSYEAVVDLDHDGTWDASIRSRCDNWLPVVWDSTRGFFDSSRANCATGDAVELELDLGQFTVTPSPPVRVLGISQLWTSGGGRLECMTSESLSVP